MITAWLTPAAMLLIAAIAMPALLFGFSAWTSYSATLHTAEIRADRTARVLEEHVSKVFESHRMVIQQVRERLRFMDWAKEGDRRDLYLMLRGLQNDLDQVATITVVDAEGRMRASGRIYPADPAIDFKDRDWFKDLRGGARGPVISSSYTGRQSKQPIFNIAVPLQDGAGAFAGGIAVSVDRAYFEAFYKEVEPDFDHSVTLVRADGEILARMPASTVTHLPSPSRFLSEVQISPSGHYIGTSVLDGVERVFGYRKITAYPVYVRFGIAVDAVFAAWWHSLIGYGLVALFSSVALAVASWLVVRQTHRERLARRRWQETAAALQAEVLERERIDAQVRQLQKMEAIGRLTGGIAHDFNNLLTAVLGNLELAGRRNTDARLGRFIDNAVDGARRAANLTGRLLAFSRQQPLQPTRVALPDLVQGMKDLLRVTLGETVALRLVPATDVWPVAIDGSQLENAILNLAVNARDAMPAGGTLSIAIGNRIVTDTSRPHLAGEIEPGDYATVSVRDDGVGMDAATITQVFEPFFTTKPIGKGTGLGLSQVYGFARQSGGGVVISSSPGKGTTVDLFLPRIAAIDAVAAASPTVPAAEPVTRARGETILVVEDEPMVRNFATAALREAGYRVLEAEDGPAALLLLATNPEVMILFTDVVLTGPMDGRALAKAAARRRHLPVLYTSGYSRDAIIHDGRLDPGVELLQKPFTSDELIRRVRASLDADIAARTARMAG